MNLKNIGIAVSLISLVGGSVIGCSNNSENGNTASNPDANAAGNTATNTSAQSKPGSADGKLRSVAFTAGDLSNPFFVLMGQEIEATAKKIGGNDVRTTVVSSAYDLNQQANQIENFTASNTDIIILNAADKSGIKPAVEKAKEAGRIVIAVDTGAEGGVDATVTTNNVQAGEVACKYIADRLKGKGNVVIVNGPQVDSVIQRVNGCQNVLAKYPDIKILSKDQNAEGSRDGGLRVMTDLLTTFPKIDAVFAINDPSGVGAELAANQAQRKDFFIVGVDGAPEAIKAIADKDGIYAATATQNPRGMAAKAVEVGNDILKGKKPQSPTILIPVKLITKDNVSTEKGW
ncbi:transcriptional regulator [Nostoc linckia z18]|uniref:Transcriptional regulator n=2 Tax=Nostoc linckia TaxID=92942 RepID=A0A9Q5Z4L7_NOSLI|nr:ABC transporter substrate-binding protein [Nostoc linckia]PHK28952.1 transcriptional regulator [Nostoc linckia z15]PHK40936.1 transcriptional regulator [Nostoc linckia z16]PHJ53922.1 transcriptional regulator [Nostoc linckia z1]PHJ61952.1 transcriptional regulator [Nostoc linckia z2]PHJ69517.1 transcriptional regulator [Nostoc linckia z3]